MPSQLSTFGHASASTLAHAVLRTLPSARRGKNSYRPKDLFIDDDDAVLTGRNPWARSLALENGLLLRDPARLLQAQHQAEWGALRHHATLLCDCRAREFRGSIRRQHVKNCGCSTVCSERR